MSAPTTDIRNGYRFPLIFFLLDRPSFELAFLRETTTLEKEFYCPRGATVKTCGHTGLELLSPQHLTCIPLATWKTVASPR